MKLHNTLSGKTEEFVPLKPGRVSMYHCGPTVYNFAHIGNLRAYVFDDTIRRSFEYLGYKVKQVINITDVGHLTSDRDEGEDKVEVEARREHKTAQEIAQFYTEKFFEDLHRLNVRTKSTKFPRATDHIKEQIALIQILEEKGYTYRTSDGIYFDTSRFPDYGKLGKIDLAHLEEGARIGKNAEKKSPTDFALWKFSPSAQTTGPGETPVKKREQEWPSLWGVGFPGWHIECSAMSMEYLGKTFDIHTGGIDHIPVHHNNEIAQSECATGQPYARYWMHNAFVNIEHMKMSKSAGNFIRLATLEEHKIHPLAYRYWLLTAHYRSPVTFTFEAVIAAQNALEALVRKVANIREMKNSSSKKSVEPVRIALQNYLENDLDTAGAIALLHKTIDDILANKIHPSILKDFDAALGLDLVHLAKAVMKAPRDAKKLAKERETLRKTNQWQAADEIRKKLETMGFMVKDTATGPQLFRSLSSLI